MRINIHLAGKKKATLSGAQILYDLIKDAEELKSKISSLKGPNDSEVEKALDDATSACDLITHHLLDIAEDK